MNSSVLVVVLCVVLFVLILYKIFAGRGKNIKESFDELKGTCSASCGALDPVNDPNYNVRETIKNTLLLEQHLADKAKYCKSCCLKHFLLSIGLLEEAIWMSGTKCCDYPELESSKKFYSDLFEEWRVGMNHDEKRLEALNQLRDWRRKMVEIYYFNGEKVDHVREH